MAIKIFGPTDRKDDGSPRSFKPSWSQEHAKEELRENIRHTKLMIKEGWLPDEASARVHLRQQEERLEAIESEKPKPTAAEKDWAAKYRNELGKIIADRQFTHSEMDMGFADPHEEVARMTEKTIKLDPEQAKESGVTLVNGMGSRKDCEKIYHHLSYVLGESSDTERLRRFGKTAQYSPVSQPPPIDSRLPEHYQAEVPEIASDSILEHEGKEVKVMKKKRTRKAKRKTTPRKTAVIIEKITDEGAE